MWFALLAAVVIGGILYYYYYSTVNKNYWKKYGIREVDTSSAASMLQVFMGKKGLHEKDEFAYNALESEKFCGLMEMGTPMILIKDVDLLKKVLIKDFDHFVDRKPMFTSEHDASLRRMLPFLEGDEWKGVRSSVSPTFTTGKIRRMMDYINSVGQVWVENLQSKAKHSETGSVTIDVLQTVNHYTIDVIGNAVFGMDTNTIKNPNSTFAKMSFRVSEMSTFKVMKYAVMIVLPKIYKFFKIQFLDGVAVKFFENILDQGLKARLKGESKRNDFLQLLVDAKNGELKAAGADELSEFEKDAQVKATEKKQYLTNEIMNGQSLVFFFAGFSSTSNFISFASYVLAAHQDVQEKLRKEVAKIVKEDGSFDYDTVGQLVYLDMVVCEVLRKYPAASRLDRLCVKEYKDPESGLFVPKGTVVVIPVSGLHHDKTYYDNADKFDPEHFSPEKKAERNPYVYLPFGMGPRNCIGMRFALTESKAAIAHLVHNFVIEPTPKTPLPVCAQPVGFNLFPPKNLELKLTPVRN